MKKRVLSFSLMFIILIGYILSPLGNLTVFALNYSKPSNAIYGGTAHLDEVWADGRVMANPGTNNSFCGGQICFDGGNIQTVLNNAIGQTWLYSGTRSVRTTTTADNFNISIQLQCNQSGWNNPNLYNNWNKYDYYYTVSSTIPDSNGKVIKTYSIWFSSKKYQPQDLYLQFKVTEYEYSYGKFTITKQYVADNSSNTSNIGQLVNADFCKKIYNNYKNKKVTYGIYSNSNNAEQNKNRIATFTCNNSTTSLVVHNTNDIYSGDGQYLKVKFSANINPKTKPLYIREISSESKSWAINDFIGTVVVEANKTKNINEKNITGINVNVPKVTNIQINKYISGSTTRVKGAQFELYYAPVLSNLRNKFHITKSNYNSKATVTYDSGNDIILLAKGTSNESGNVDWTIEDDYKKQCLKWNFIAWQPELRGPIGFYAIIETEAPNGFEVTSPKYFVQDGSASRSDSTKPYEYTSDSEQFNETGTNANWWKMYDPEEYSLSVKKEYLQITAEGTDIVGNFYEMFPLQYARSKAEYSLFFGPSYDSNDKIKIAKITTDDSGQGSFTIISNPFGLKLSNNNKKLINIPTTAAFKNTKYQNYKWYLKEEKAPKGYKLNTFASSGLSITKVGTSFSGVSGEGSISALRDAPITGSIHLDKKVYKYNGENWVIDSNYSLSSGKLNGTKFRLYYYSGNSSNPYYIFNKNLTITESTTVTNTSAYKSRTISPNQTSNNTDILKQNNIYYIGDFTISNNKIEATNHRRNVYVNTIHKGWYKPTVATDSNGNDYFKDLPLGSYCLIETKTPTYSRNTENISFSLDPLNVITLSENVTNGKVKMTQSTTPKLNNENKPYASQNTELNQTTGYTNDFNKFVVSYKMIELNDLTMNLRVTKSSEQSLNGRSLEGSIYSVYYNRKSIPNIQVTYNNSKTATVNANGSTLVAKFKTDKNGYGKLFKNNNDSFNYSTKNSIDNSIFKCDQGYYSIVETQLPDDNSFDWDKTIYKKYLSTNSGNSQITAEVDSTVKSLEPDKPSPKDPLLLKITKTINGDNLTNITPKDYEVIKTLEGTEFILNFYTGVQKRSDVINDDGEVIIDPDLTIKYKTYIDDENPTQVIIDFNKLETDKYEVIKGNINDFKDESGYVVFPIGIYTIQEITATDGYNINNKIWKYTDMTLNNVTCSSLTINGVNNGLLFRVIQNTNDLEDAVTQIYNTKNTDTLQDDTWSITNIINGSFNVEKPNDTETGSFKFNKIISETDEKNLDNVYFNLYSLDTTDYNLTTIEHFACNENILFLPDGNPANSWNPEYITMINKSIVNKDSPIRCRSNNGKSEIFSNVSHSYVNSEDVTLPIGNYLLIETRCDANKGLILSKPVIIIIEKDKINTIYFEKPIINYKPILNTTEYDYNTSTLIDIESESGETTTEIRNKNKLSSNFGTMKIRDDVEYYNLKANTNYSLIAIMTYKDGNVIKPVKINNKIVQAIKPFNTTTNSSTVNTNNNIANGTVTVEFADIDPSKLLDQNITKFIIYEFLFKEGYSNIIDDLKFEELSNGTPNDNLSDGSSNSELKSNAIIINDKYFGHYDINDINQTGYIPKISTYAKGSTGNKITRLLSREIVETNDNDNDNDNDTDSDIQYEQYVILNDTLFYTGLIPNKSYKIYLNAKVWDDTPSSNINDVVLYTNTYTFIPTHSSGQYKISNIEFIVTDDINKIYITETIYDDTGVLIADHENMLTEEEKTAQSVTVGRISTSVDVTNVEIESQNNINVAILPENGIITLKDTLYYKNFIPTYLNNTTNEDELIKYTIKCTYYNANTGKVLKDKDRNPVEMITTPQELIGDGSIDIKIENVDLSNYVGKNVKITATELIYYTDLNNNNHIVAKEYNLDSPTQSLLFLGTSIKFNKVDQNNEPVIGAELEIRQDTVDGNLIANWITTDEIKEFTINISNIDIEDSLKPGTYYLVEKSTPSSPYRQYKFADPILFKISNDGKVYIINGETEAEIISKSITMIDEYINLTRLPTAGGMGTITFTIIGLSVMCIPVIMISRKKKRKF